MDAIEEYLHVSKYILIAKFVFKIKPDGHITQQLGQKAKQKIFIFLKLTLRLRPRSGINQTFVVVSSEQLAITLSLNGENWTSKQGALWASTNG